LVTLLGLELWFNAFVVSFNGDFYFCIGVDAPSLIKLVFIVFKFYFLGVVTFIVLSILLLETLTLFFYFNFETAVFVFLPLFLAVCIFLFYLLVAA
jgi:hypothetical protein